MCKPVKIVATAALLLLWLGVLGLGATAPPHGEAAEAPRTADELRRQVVELGSKGNLTGELIALFKQYADACARERLVPAHVSEEFWNRIAADEVLHDALLVELYPEYEPGVVACLKTLTEKFGQQFDRHKHLALAFAIAYGRAGQGSTLQPGLRHRYASPRRPEPSLEESFAYYLKYEKKAMKMSLVTTPWPMLAFVADNDIPIEEREWALGRYAKKASLEKIYYDVPYDTSRIKGEGRIGDRPYTLQNLLTYGGVCMERAYYTSRVLKSLGIPGMYDCGEGARGGHAWVSWVGRRGKQADLLFSGRFDYDKYYRGEVFCPVKGTIILDRDVQLLTAAMVHSYEGWLQARIGCHIYDLLDPETRGKVAGLLDGAVRRNPYGADVWRLMARDVAEGVLSREVGEKMYDQMFRHFAAYPDLTFEVLEKILAPRLAAAETEEEKEVRRNLKILEQAFKIYEQSKRPDLAVKLRSLQGAYLEAAGRTENALKLYVLAAERYVADHYGFLGLFDRAVALMQNLDMRLKYLKIMAEKVPRYRGLAAPGAERETNPAFVHVVEVYVAALREAGRSAEADRWERRIRKKEE
ncbi:MAG TPA: hypothetical protein VM219_05900 [Phycisphaerae bacterium]|nr:hypothetical protein [Phycisphaerae bacterium]